MGVVLEGEVILVLGASGYIGSAFVKELETRALAHAIGIRKNCDYTNEGVLRDQLAVLKPKALINAAAFIPTPSVDLCKDNKPETWRANVHLPVMLARVCQELGITFCHISTGCLYDEKGEYTEADCPTRLDAGYCSVYLSTKFFAEALVHKLCEKHYTWRIRLPFDEIDHPKNYLTKLKSYSTIWDQNNSLTHRGDFVKAALDMIEKKAPFGTYHMVNKGAIGAKLLHAMLAVRGLIDDAHTFSVMAKGPVSGSILSTAKLEATGCGMRPVSDAVVEALKNWRKE